MFQRGRTCITVQMFVNLRIPDKKKHSKMEFCSTNLQSLYSTASSVCRRSFISISSSQHINKLQQSLSNKLWYASMYVAREINKPLHDIQNNCMTNLQVQSLWKLNRSPILPPNFRTCLAVQCLAWPAHSLGHSWTVLEISFSDILPGHRYTYEMAEKCEADYFYNSNIQSEKENTLL